MGSPRGAKPPKYMESFREAKPPNMYMGRLRGAKLPSMHTESFREAKPPNVYMGSLRGAKPLSPNNSPSPC